MSRRNPAGKVLFYLLLCSYVVATLAQKSFPTQDGPLHLYYADVITHLLRGDGAYGDYFTIKHWLPPYAFHAYVLVALNGLVAPLDGGEIAGRPLHGGVLPGLPVPGSFSEPR